MSADLIKTALTERKVLFSLQNGDLFFRRQSDGQGMYVRCYDDGTYNWSQVDRSDMNAMDYTEAKHNTLERVLRRIDDFLGLVVSGNVIIDTLGLVRRSMELGLSPKEAEEIAKIARKLALEMHESGMDAGEIRTRFSAVHEQLRRERLRRAS